MLFFIDESWQSTQDGKYKVGVLSAIQIKSHDFNECSKQIYELKIKNLGYRAGDLEIKGREILRNYLFELESKGIKSKELNLVRDILTYMQTLGIKLFASIVFSKKEIDLACANVNQLERPFFFLFERIDLFMKENYPGLMAKLIFDDRGIQFNKKISKSVSNFFHKSSIGQEFDTIIKVPFFAISTENVGIQMADIVAHILGSRFTGDKKQIEFFKKVKSLEFISRTLVDIRGKMLQLLGFKVVKEKEAGDLFSPGRTV
ncbi:MAG: DUF3800 domain-containing protein [Nitrospirae bacterium]|nr:DUF3800 domain-containing protein [Nitrospirota bacterium]